MLIDTQFVIRLNFVLNNNHAIFLLASYLEAKEDLPSVTKHVPFLVEFMLWHKLKNLQAILLGKIFYILHFRQKNKNSLRFYLLQNPFFAYN